MPDPTFLLIGLVLDLLLGWPPAVHARLGHPVTWLGALIDGLDRRLNRAPGGPGVRTRLLGIGAAVLVVAVAAGAALLAIRVVPDGWVGTALLGVLAWPLLATRSLFVHVRDVATPLAAGDLPVARQRVAMIVGRDPTALDTAGVGRAALESLAENASDAVTAPVVWGLVLGLPGLAAYKAVNTLDSMIGHRTPRHRDFGWASARLDDLVNLIPARLTGLLLAVVSPHPGAALACMRRDARRHRSPNAGWCEAAMAGGLGVRLSGPRSYGKEATDEPWLNDGARDPDPRDVRRGLYTYGRAMALLLCGVALCAAVAWSG